MNRNGSGSALTMSRWRRVYYVVPVVALIIPFLANEYLLWVVNAMLVYSLVTVGFNIVIGNLGQLAFANTAFFGIGAYTTAILMVYLGFPYPLAIAVAATTGGVAGFLASVAALRGIRLYYLATHHACPSGELIALVTCPFACPDGVRRPGVAAASFPEPRSREGPYHPWLCVRRPGHTRALLNLIASHRASLVAFSGNKTRPSEQPHRRNSTCPARDADSSYVRSGPPAAWVARPQTRLGHPEPPCIALADVYILPTTGVAGKAFPIAIGHDGIICISALCS